MIRFLLVPFGCRRRQYVARRRAAGIRYKLASWAASLTLQCAWRSYQARLHRSKLQQRRDLELASATKLQCAWRSSVARAEANRRRYIRDLPLLQAKCATKIQALCRQCLQRRRFMSMKQCVRVSVRHFGSMRCNWVCFNDDSNVCHHQAVRIQTFFRGFAARRRVDMLRLQHKSATRIQVRMPRLPSYILR